MTSTAAAFIIPVLGDQPRSIQYLDEAIGGIEQQSDDSWQIIIVDDATPSGDFQRHLEVVDGVLGDRLTVVRLDRRSGHGHARNIGIQVAADLGCPFILYNDADDISHPDRLRVVRGLMDEEPAPTGLVYSTFVAIDEDNQEIPLDQLVATNQDSLAVQRSDPITGVDAWLRIGLDSGSACLPSSTALRTTAALECPSPVETPSEDTYQWMHLSAAGWSFSYTPDVPTRYRVTSSVRGSTHHRRRIGERNFYESTVTVRTSGFVKALEVALERGRIDSREAPRLLALFQMRLADNMVKVGWPSIASSVLTSSPLSESYPGLMRLFGTAGSDSTAAGEDPEESE